MTNDKIEISSLADADKILKNVSAIGIRPPAIAQVAVTEVVKPLLGELVGIAGMLFRFVRRNRNVVLGLGSAGLLIFFAWRRVQNKRSAGASS